MPDIAYIALGTNMGDRHANLAFARSRIAAMRQCTIVAESSVEETEAIVPDGEPQDKYLNQMIALETTLTPLQLLDALQTIEREAGRVRSKKWAPRTLDIDIVVFGDAHIVDDRLTVPHPELRNRVFWQRELKELKFNGTTD